jgi:hypothetical protein
MSDIKFRRLKSGKVYATLQMSPTDTCDTCSLKPCSLSREVWSTALDGSWWELRRMPGVGCPWYEKKGSKCTTHNLRS